MGNNMMLSDEMVVLFALYFFIHHWMDMTYVYLEAAGLWWDRRYFTLIAAGVNLFFNIILVQLIGLPGVLLSTIISVLFVYDIADVHVLSSSYFKENSIQWEQAVIQVKYLVKYLIVTCVVYGLCRILTIGVVGTFIYRMLVCIIIAPLLLILVHINDREFKEAKIFIGLIIKNRLGKRKMG